MLSTMKSLIEILYHFSHIVKKLPCSYSSPQSSFSKATYMVNLTFPMFCYTKNTNNIHLKFVCKRLHAMKVSRWFILVATVITFYNNISWVFTKVNFFRIYKLHNWIKCWSCFLFADKYGWYDFSPLNLKMHECTAISSCDQSNLVAHTWLARINFLKSLHHCMPQ